MIMYDHTYVNSHSSYSIRSAYSAFQLVATLHQQQQQHEAPKYVNINNTAIAIAIAIAIIIA
jgi:hypothetical protein